MDPQTTVVVLAIQLMASGGLLYLIGRQMPPRGGMQLWAGGTSLFGLSYIARRLQAPDAALPWVLLTDVGLIAATLLLVAGLRQFIGHERVRLRTGLALLIGAGLLQAATALGYGLHGRVVMLNLTLGLVYGWLAAEARRLRRRGEPAMRKPLTSLTWLIGLLALATLARSGSIALAGPEAMYRGALAQIFYAYAALAAMLLVMNLLWMVFVRINGRLAEMATRDALTRLLNRTGFEEALRRYFGTRGSPPLTLLAIDVDHFKRINDNHGHAAGDAVLRALAATLTRELRPSDLVARVGGEEFIVCFAVPDPETALALGERLRRAIAVTTPADVGRESLRCTVSVGVSAPFGAVDDWARASAEADRALYAAKEAGRDRVAVA